MTDSLISNKKQKIEILSLTLFSLILTSFWLVFFSSSCRLYNLEKKLDPVNAEFLSKVRYIITSKERKIFLGLPDSEKEKFRKEFWKRRDPDPSTEENEFKMEYYNRIEKANETFISEGEPGWLTDRGRIFILFGPPTDRISDNLEQSTYNRCREIWYYGNFPVIFIDRTCTGNYRLATHNFSPIRDISLTYMQELSRAEAKARQTIIREESKFLDFDLSVEKTLVEEERLEGQILIGVPYASLWFKAAEEKLETTLDVHLELKDSEGHLRWVYRDSYHVETKEENLKKNLNKNYKIEVPFIIEEGIGELKKGKNRLYARILNKTGGEELRKVFDFDF